MKTYDVIVAGAGIPGLWAARELALHGKSVLVIEQHRVIGEPNYSTAGIPIATLEEFNLPRSGVNAKIHHFIFASTTHEARVSSDAPWAYVLNFRKTKQLLVTEGLRAGATYVWGTKVLRQEKSKNIHVVETQKETFHSRYLMDATGTPGVLITNADIRKAQPDALSVGMEYILTVKSSWPPRFIDSLALIIDPIISPYGYAWVFADGPSQYKVGVIEFWKQSSRNVPALVERLDNLVSWIGIKHVKKIEERHGGTKILSTQFPHAYSGTLVGIGDAVGAISPLFAEGIRHGLVSAKLAVNALLVDDGTGKNFMQYQAAWNTYKRQNNWNIMYMLAKYIMYKKFSSTFIHAIISYVRLHVTITDVVDFAFYHRLRPMIRNPRFFLPLLFKQLFR